MKKILLIEDEKILSDMYQDKFSKAGFKVITSYEAEEGFELAKKEKPDLIVLDILLPRENGIMFLEKMKKEQDISSIPVLILSNFDEPDTKAKADKLGVEGYMIKSNHTPQEIITEIKKILE